MSEHPEPQNGRRAFSFGLQSYMGGVFAALLLAAGAVLAGIGYYQMSRTVEADVEERIDAMALHVLHQTELEIFHQIRPFLETFANGEIPKAATLEERLSYLPLLQAALRGRPILNSLFVAWDDGGFFLVKIIATDEERALFDAPADAALMIRYLEPGPVPAQGERLFYDGGLRLLERRDFGAIRGYYPPARDWYVEAMQTDGMVEVPPRVLVGTDSACIVFAQRGRGGRAVVAVDVLLAQYSGLLERELPTPGSRLAVFRGDGTPIANARSMVAGPEGQRTIRTLEDFHPVLREGVAARQRGLRNDDTRVRFAGEDWFVAVEELDPDDPQGDFLVLAIPGSELFAHADAFFRELIFIRAGVLLLSAPIVAYAARRLARPLRLLADQAKHPHAPGNGEAAQHSGVAEIDTLAQGVGHLHEQHRKLLSILRLVGGERDMRRLVRNILQESVAVADMDGGGLVVMDEAGQFETEGCYCWRGGAVRTAAVPGLYRVERSGGGVLGDSVWSENGEAPA